MIHCVHGNKNLFNIQSNHFSIPFTRVAELDAVNFVLHREINNVENFYLSCVIADIQNEVYVRERILTVCSWSSDVFSGLPLPM